MQKICYTERIGKSVEQICYLSRALHILKWKERLQKASFLHGADWEICWTDMLLVKGSSYSKKKGTVAKDMLHGADREICLRRYAISQGLFIFWNEMNGCKRPLYYTERIGKSVWGDMLLVKGSLWVGASFLHGTEREICWIHFSRAIS